MVIIDVVCTSIMKKEQAGQREIPSIEFEEKRSTRKCHGAKSGPQGDKKFKEKPGTK